MMSLNYAPKLLQFEERFRKVPFSAQFSVNVRRLTWEIKLNFHVFERLAELQSNSVKPKL